MLVLDAVTDLVSFSIGSYSRSPGREEAREVLDSQVRRPPDGSDQKAAQGRDVDVREAPGALWRGESKGKVP